MTRPDWSDVIARVTSLIADAAEADRTSTPEGRDGGRCEYAGPGRGDCEHFVGLPGESLPGQHDGPDDTVDVYGKPNGWCWSCWYQERERRLWAESTTLRDRILELEGELDAATRRASEWEEEAGEMRERVAHPTIAAVLQELHEEMGTGGRRLPTWTPAEVAWDAAGRPGLTSTPAETEDATAPETGHAVVFDPGAAERMGVPLGEIVPATITRRGPTETEDTVFCEVCARDVSRSSARGLTVGGWVCREACRADDATAPEDCPDTGVPCDGCGSTMLNCCDGATAPEGACQHTRLHSGRVPGPAGGYPDGTMVCADCGATAPEGETARTRPLSEVLHEDDGDRADWWPVQVAIGELRKLVEVFGWCAQDDTRLAVLCGHPGCLPDWAPLGPAKGGVNWKRVSDKAWRELPGDATELTDEAITEAIEAAIREYHRQHQGGRRSG